MNVYGRVREDRLADAVEHIGQVVFDRQRVPAEYRQAVGEEQKNATPAINKELRFKDFGSAGRTRTYDQVINSHPLGQLSYRGSKVKYCCK